MKRNEKYKYNIPNAIVRPFIFLYYTTIIAWRDSGKGYFYLKLDDIPMWVIRQLGVMSLRKSQVTQLKTGVVASSERMLLACLAEWSHYKRSVLKYK